MDAIEAIGNQKAVRDYADRPIEQEQLDLIMQAAAWAPSSHNAQRWAFISVTDRAVLNQLATVGTWTDHLAGAPAAIAFVNPVSDDADERESIALDLGQAVQNAMLAAMDLGIGSSHASVHEPERVREILGIPPDHRCDTLIAFGYPADPAVLTRQKTTAARKPVAEVVHRERW